MRPIGASIRGIDCPSKKTVSLGEVVACHRILIEQDIYIYERGLYAFRTRFAEIGITVLSSRPQVGHYLELRATSMGTGWNRTERIRLEILDPEGRLRYFAEDVVSRRFYWEETRGMTNHLCPVLPVRCP
ncbi:MAG TPA: hypothetical protein VJJ22_01955 [Candidatus Paceibacterota bacterium]